MICMNCGKDAKEGDIICSQCGAVLAVSDVVTPKINIPDHKPADLDSLPPPVETVYKKPDYIISHISVIAGLLLILSWFVITWSKIGAFPGISFFGQVSPGMNFSFIPDAYHYGGVGIGTEYCLIVIFFYGLWFLPISGFASFFAFMNKRSVIRTISILSRLATISIVGFIAIFVMMAGQSGISIPFSDFGAGFYLSIISSLWLTIATMVDLNKNKYAVTDGYYN